MGFASTYLEKSAIFSEFIKEAPDKQTGIIVIVPAYNEPDISKLLCSLASCDEPQCGVEVIIVVNAPAIAANDSLENNKITLKNIETWKQENCSCFFRLYAFDPGGQSFSDWGVGLARKTGMDEAVRRFDNINNSGGVILNLDADCLVEKNYFVSVYNELFKNKHHSACSIYFEHPLSGNDFPDYVYKNITLYELHLRYYFQGLAYSGFPFVFHTVGSAFAVKSLDNGVTWQNMPGIRTSNVNRIVLAVTPAAPNTIYALLSNSQNGYGGLYKSIDAGANWVQIHVRAVVE